MELYESLLSIALSDITELSVTKDLIANEVNSIQDSTAQTQQYSAPQESDPFRAQQDLLRVSSPPMIAETPQVPSTTGSLIDMATPIEEQL